MRIVWIFGDGHTQYTYVDPRLRMPDETEAMQIDRLKVILPTQLIPHPGKLDKRMRDKKEYQEYRESLGAGAVAVFAGLVSDAEYEDKRARLGEFRDGWTWTSAESVIDFDMDKCREIKQHDLRRMREPLLKAADIEYLRAIEAGDTKAQAAIAERKQALRDVTDDPAIAAAQTPEELKAVLPDVLKG